MSMNRNVLASLMLAVLLSACAKPDSVPPTAIFNPPNAQRLQKAGQYGHTDYNQRKEDIIACGVPRERYEDNLFYITGTAPGETTEQYLVRRRKFARCMNGKGYDWLDWVQCGSPGTRQKQYLGICK